MGGEYHRQRENRHADYTSPSRQWIQRNENVAPSTNDVNAFTSLTPSKMPLGMDGPGPSLVNAAAGRRRTVGIAARYGRPRTTFVNGHGPAWRCSELLGCFCPTRKEDSLHFHVHVGMQRLHHRESSWVRSVLGPAALASSMATAPVLAQDPKGSAEVAPDPVRACEDPRRVPANHPPSWPSTIVYGEGALPSNQGQRVMIRWGRVLEFEAAASDPDGDTIQYIPRHLPHGASFDPTRCAFSWRPTRNDMGKHSVIIEATDGRLSALLRITITVDRNRPPVAEYDFRKPEVHYVGQQYSGAFVSDPDGDPVTLEVRSVPGSVRMRSQGSQIVYDWEPSEADTGERVFDFVVSDGNEATHFQRRISVLPTWAATDQSVYLAPVAGYSGYVTSANGHVFHGGTVSLMLWAHSQRGHRLGLCTQGPYNDCPPSLLGLYLSAEVLYPTRDTGARAFTYALGLTRAFEFGPARRWLIPAASAELGGWVDERVGHVVQVSPLLGVHLWTDRHVWLDLCGGYRFVPAELQQLSGARMTLSLLVNAW